MKERRKAGDHIEVDHFVEVRQGIRTIKNMLKTNLNQAKHGNMQIWNGLEAGLFDYVIDDGGKLLPAETGYWNNM